jgi:hypothetical protein
VSVILEFYRIYCLASILFTLAINTYRKYSVSSFFERVRRREHSLTTLKLDLEVMFGVESITVTYNY